MFFRTNAPQRRNASFGLLWLGVISWLGLVSNAWGQPRLQIKLNPNIARQGVEEEPDSLAGGSPLDLDRRLKQNLEVAEEEYASGNTADALQRWQYVLTRANNTLTTQDDWSVTFAPPERTYQVYRSIADEIERRLAKLPADDLRLYRQTYDPDANVVLQRNAGESRLGALVDVVDQYFISSHGDEAAYYLALLWFDQGDYARSARMLEKILAHYPDSEISPKQIRLRLAVTSARMRDSASAKKHWKEYRELSGGDAPAAIRQMFQQELARAANPLAAGGSRGESWPMRYGAPARNRDMPPLPQSAVKDKLSETWSRKFDTLLEQTQTNNNNNRRSVVFAGGVARLTSAQSTGQRKPLADEWRDNGWMPARRLFFDQDRLFINGNGRVLCFDTEEGRVLWKGRRYQYLPDPSMNYYKSVNAKLNGESGRLPDSWPEIRLFGDRLHPLMSLHDDTVYALEGKLLDWGVEPNNASPNTNTAMGRRRSRTNWLAAYDAATGKLKWHRSARDVPNQGEEIPTAFLAAPIPFGDRLLVPVANKGELWLHSLKQETGETDWKVFLWDEPLGGVSPWSAVGTAIEGGDIYLATGMGLVFALDAATGKVHWAVKYPRKGAFPTSNPRRINRAMIAQAAENGWMEDVVIPHGNQLVVLPSDYGRIVTLDRRTGDLLWDTSQDAIDGLQAKYCLGVSGDGLFVAGREILRMYEVPTGKMVWEVPIENSLGQAALTPDAIYVPSNDEIVKLDPADGNVLGQTDVYTPTGEPVGNLFSDGRHLYGVGMQRVYALASLTDRLETLAKKIQQGDGEAQLVRMRIHLQRDNLPAAIDDLEAGVDKIRKRQGIWPAWKALNSGLLELDLANAKPETALRLIVKTRQPAVAENSRSRHLSDSEMQTVEFERSHLLFVSLANIQTDPEEASLTGVLAATNLCTTPQLERQAVRTVAAVAGKEDRGQLESALKDGEVPTRLAAAKALRNLFPEDSASLARSLLDDPNDRVQLEGATVLAKRTRRDVLPRLSRLLESEDVNVRVHAASILRALTKQNFRFTAYEKPEDRAEIVAKWNRWIETEGQTAELVHPLNYGGEPRGRTLYTSYNQSAIFEIDEDGKQVWKKTGISRPWSCQGLPNGNRLVTSYQGKSVHEYDEAGKEVWNQDNLPGYPFSVQRLPNGNTLVSCSDNRKTHRVIEYTPAGKIAWEANLSGTPRDAQRLDNGNTLVANYSRHEVVELDPKGKVVWKADNMNRPIRAQRLPNGRTLIAQYNARRIVELDPSKNVVWSKRWSTSIYDVQRLSNGNTLIADNKGIHEITPEGKTVYEKNQSGVRGICRY